MKESDTTEIARQLRKIASALGWACIWLFCIAVNTCDGDERQRVDAFWYDLTTDSTRVAEP